MIIVDGLAYIDMPLTVGQLEEILSTIKNKETPVCVNDESCADSEITSVFILDSKVSFSINGEVFLNEEEEPMHLTDFEKELGVVISEWQESELDSVCGIDSDYPLNGQQLRRSASKLMALARKQIKEEEA